MFFVIESLLPMTPLFELVRVFKPELLPVFLRIIAFCWADGVDAVAIFWPFSLGRRDFGAEPGLEDELFAEECRGLKATLFWSLEIGVPP